MSCVQSPRAAPLDPMTEGDVTIFGGGGEGICSKELFCETADDNRDAASSDHEYSINTLSILCYILLVLLFSLMCRV